MAPVFGEIASTSVGGVSPTPTWRPAIITTTIIAHNPAIHQWAVLLSLKGHHGKRSKR